MHKYEMIIRALPNVLPVNHYQEAADKLARRLRLDVSIQDVIGAVSRTRDNPTHWGVIVPSVKRGPLSPEDRRRFAGGKGRIYCVVESDPAFLNEIALEHLVSGLLSTQRVIATIERRLANICEKVAAKIASPRLRRSLRDQADDLRQIERRTQRMIAELLELRAA